MQCGPCESHTALVCWFKEWPLSGEEAWVALRSCYKWWVGFQDRMLTGLFLSSHRLLHGLHAVCQAHATGEEGTLQVFHGRGGSVTPDAPLVFLTGPAELLDDKVFGAVLLLGVVGHGSAVSGGTVGRRLGRALRLTAGDAQDDLANSGVGDFGDLSRTIRHDANTGEIGARGANVTVQVPSDTLALGTGSDAGAQLVGKTGATHLAQGRSIAAMFREDC